MPTSLCRKTPVVHTPLCPYVTKELRSLPDPQRDLPRIAMCRSPACCAPHW